jgi:MarR family transcriptional regulator, negative regulator of the multidrug operon emrRAB
MSHADVAREANLVGALALAIADRLAEAAEPGLGGSAAQALATLHGEAAGASIDALARIVGLTHSGTVRLVDRLAGAGLVERRTGADARSTSLYLTPAGRRVARRTLARREAAIQSVLAGLSRADRSALARVSETVLADLATDLVTAADADRRICRLCDTEACGRRRGTCPVAATV